MQEVSTYGHQQMKPQFPEQEHLKCPRCDSDNTKFCYYNNYNLSQPRHYCKGCRRYWTRGGALRNIPVGGGSRRPTKRSAPSNTKRSSVPKSDPPELYTAPALDVGGSFTSLMASPLSGQFGNLVEGTSPGLQLGEDQNSKTETNLMAKPELNQNGNNDESVNYLDIVGSGGEDDSSSCWDSGNGWPHLAIYTPGSTFP